MKSWPCSSQMPPTPSLTIRDARQDELDTISQVLLSAYGEYARRYTRREWEGYRRNIADVRSRTGIGELIVAELQGRIVGAVTFYPIGAKSGDPWPQGWAGIRLLAVDAGARGIGAGRALMEECVRRCRERGVDALGLHTSEFMSVAKGMYERMGFVRRPEFDYHPRPDYVIMAYSLDVKSKEP